MESLFKGLFEKVNKSENSQNYWLLDALWMSVDDAIDKRVFDSFDRDNLVNDLKNLSVKELIICRNNLENRLKKEVINLLFWDNIEEIEKRDFSWHDLYNYIRGYLWDTDFGQSLPWENIFIDEIWGRWFDKKILLSVQSRIDRYVNNGVEVNIPFYQQYYNQSGIYKTDTDHIDIKYLWKRDKIECIVKLIKFIQGIQKSIKNVSGDRKLWVFGKK